MARPVGVGTWYLVAERNNVPITFTVLYVQYDILYHAHLDTSDRRISLILGRHMGMRVECCILNIAGSVCVTSSLNDHANRPLSVTSSCAIMPATASMARRPLFSSLFCIASRPASSFGFSPSGSKLRSPGWYMYSYLLDRLRLEPAGCLSLLGWSLISERRKRCARSGLRATAHSARRRGSFS